MGDIIPFDKAERCLLQWQAHNDAWVAAHPELWPRLWDAREPGILRMLGPDAEIETDGCIVIANASTWEAASELTFLRLADDGWPEDIPEPRRRKPRP